MSLEKVYKKIDETVPARPAKDWQRLFETVTVASVNTFSQTGKLARLFREYVIFGVRSGIRIEDLTAIAESCDELTKVWSEKLRDLGYSYELLAKLEKELMKGAKASSKGGKKK